MADYIIHDLPAVASVASSDEFEVQKSGETSTKRATLSQVTSVEATARASQDDKIEDSVGLETNGDFPSTTMNNTWYLRSADFIAGMIDRGGAQTDIEEQIIGALRLLDAKIYASILTSKSDTAHATFKSPTATSGKYHCFGFYDAPVAHKAFTQAATNVSYGTANNPYCAYVFVVAKEAGAASGGTNGTAKITITGTSYNDNGVRTSSDSEILVADVTTLSANKYVQSKKLWIGTITLTIVPTGDHTTYSATCNYGFAAPYNFNESSVVIDSLEATGRGGAADTGFNLQLLKHSSTGWTYSAAAFTAGGTVIADMSVDYNATERSLAIGTRFRWVRDELAVAINGTYTSYEGVVIRITTTQNNAVESSDFRLHYHYV